MLHLLLFLVTLCSFSGLFGRSEQKIGVLRHVDMLSEDQIANLEKLFEKKGARYEDQGVIRFTFPRHFAPAEMTDKAPHNLTTTNAASLRTTLLRPAQPGTTTPDAAHPAQVAFANRHLNEFMGLATWVSFQKGKKTGIETMMMGDVVLFENQINPAIDAALAHGIAVTAIHHHFLYDTPKVYHMHIEAEGAVKAISQGISDMLKAIVHAPAQQPSFGADHNNIKSEELSKILGIPGEAKDGMFKFVAGRTVQAGCGCTVGAAMGINTWGTFSGSQEHAVVDGDFVLLEKEVEPVMRYLRKAGFLIVSLHNHMLFETPRLIFMHYIGYGPAVALAQTLKGALALTAPTINH